jgi:hypothetical protein
MQGFVAGGGSALGIAFAAIPVIGAVVAIVSGLFSIFAGGTDLKPITEAINKLAHSTAEGLDYMKRFSWSIGRLALSGLFFIARIVGDMLKPILNALRSLAAALKKIYEDVLKPIARALQHARKILDDIYRKWLRPIINVIQRVRRVLAILRAFGFKWAGALDARLARIEGKIIGPYIWLVRQMNGYGRWINVILTAGGAIQKPLFLNSAYANLGGLTNMLWWGQMKQGWTPSSAIGTSPSAPTTFAAVQSDFDVYVRTGAGDLAQTASDARSAFLLTQAGA